MCVVLPYSASLHNHNLTEQIDIRAMPVSRSQSDTSQTERPRYCARSVCPCGLCSAILQNIVVVVTPLPNRIHCGSRVLHLRAWRVYVCVVSLASASRSLVREYLTSLGYLSSGGDSASTAPAALIASGTVGVPPPVVPFTTTATASPGVHARSATAAAVVSTSALDADAARTAIPVVPTAVPGTAAGDVSAAGSTKDAATAAAAAVVPDARPSAVYASPQRALEAAGSRYGECLLVWARCVRRVCRVPTAARVMYRDVVVSLL